MGPKEVTAADIIGDAEMEIYNPDLHIATLEDNAALVMEINLARGRGYVSAEMNKTEDTPDIRNTGRFDIHARTQSKRVLKSGERRFNQATHPFGWGNGRP